MIDINEKIIDIRDNILDFLGSLLDVKEDTADAIFDTCTVLICFWLIRKAVLYLISKKVSNIARMHTSKKIFGSVLSIMLMLIIAKIWIEDQKSMVNFLGLLAAGLAIALQDMIKCFAGWIYILLRRPFSTGDRVQIGETQGDVIDIGAWKVTLNEINDWADQDQSTGRIIHIPNSQLLTKPIANYTAEFAYIWNELRFIITFESDWQKTRELMDKTCDRHVQKFTEKEAKNLRHSSENYMLVYTKLTPIVYTAIKENGVQITLRYLVKPRDRRFSEDKIWRAILTIIDENDDINLAYNTIRIHQEK